MEAINLKRTNQSGGQAFITRYKTALCNLASDAAKETVYGDAAELQSIIGTVYALCDEERICELHDALRKYFPEFYLNQAG